MDVSIFDYELPEERIALRPERPRDRARLLHVDPSQTSEPTSMCFRDLPTLLDPRDALVLNDTAVVPAKLAGERIRWQSRAKVSLNLVQQLAGSTWRALARPLRKISADDDLIFYPPGCRAASPTLAAHVDSVGRDTLLTITFACDRDVLMNELRRTGVVPLPPYIERRRPADLRDVTDYQTTFAARPGAVAAPTAGLHFTDELLEAIARNGTPIFRSTLHVGAGTFLPVICKDTQNHVMHREWGELTEPVAHALNQHRANGGRIVAVGTTALRLLETALGAGNRFAAFRGETDLFITPGYRVRAVDRLLTNFHMPRSTLLMLVSAFAGIDCVKNTYAFALKRSLRFCSFGDACLFERANHPEPA